ncbi:MAG: hypothetical protein J6R22_04745 [Alphaproteobacteria bacterium]|nr:hypothetical protein [Alphaproteobacteria bacterium]
MSAKRILFTAILMPVLMMVTAHAEIAGKTYVDRVSTYTAANSTVTISSDRKIAVASASIDAKGVAKLGEIPYKVNGAVQSTNAMIWVE